MLGTTILRRGKMLSKEMYLTPEAFLGIPDLPQHQKWLKWAENETQKRLVYFAVMLDAHSSITQRSRVLFSYAELKTPLPSSTRLWDAETSSSWFDILQQDTQLRTQQPPSMFQSIRYPQLLTAQKCNIDATIAASITLAGFWSLISEYQQMSAIISSTPLCNNSVLDSRYADLSSALGVLDTEFANLQANCPEVVLAQELMSLHLNVSLYQLLDYAGMGTEADAHAALPYINHWFESPKCRLALWHAGQIFRITRAFKHKRLADFYALALYQATLTIWVWSLLRISQEPGTTSNRRMVVLDGEESSATSKFLKLYPAEPCLTTNSGDFCPLTNPVTAPDIANGIFRANWYMDQMPRTSQEVSRMLEGFSSICRRKLASAGTGTSHSTEQIG